MIRTRRVLQAITFSKVVTALIVVFLLAPLAIVIANSFNADAALLRWRGFTMEWYAEAVADPNIQYAFYQTVYVAVWVMVGTTIVATAAALGVRAYTGRPKAALNSAVILRMVLPEVVVVSAVFIFGVMFDLPRGYLLLILAQIVLNSGFAILMIRARSETVSELYESAAADLGAPPRRVYLRVLVPLLAPALAVSALLTFTFSFDSVTSAVLLGGPEVQTLTVYLMGMVRHGITAESNAISVMITVFNLIVLAIIVRLTGVRGLLGTTSRN